jgi:hypothetical protein
MGESKKSRQDAAPIRQDVAPTRIRPCTILIADRASEFTEIVLVIIIIILTNPAKVGLCLGYRPGRMPGYTATGRQTTTRCHPRGAMGLLEAGSFPRIRLEKRCRLEIS